MMPGESRRLPAVAWLPATLNKEFCRERAPKDTKRSFLFFSPLFLLEFYSSVLLTLLRAKRSCVDGWYHSRRNINQGSKVLKHTADVWTCLRKGHHAHVIIFNEELQTSPRSPMKMLEKKVFCGGLFLISTRNKISRHHTHVIIFNEELQTSPRSPMKMLEKKVFCGGLFLISTRNKISRHHTHVIIFNKELRTSPRSPMEMLKKKMFLLEDYF